MQPMQAQAGPVQSVLTSNMIPRPISFHDGSAPSYITPYVLGQDVGLQHPQAQIFQLNGDASGTPSALSGQVHVPGHPLAMMSPQVVWVQAQNGVLTPMCIVPAAQSSAISRPQHVPSQPSSALALNTSSQTPYQIVMPTSELPVPSGNGTLPQIMYTTADDTRSFSAQEGADGRPRVEVMRPIDSYASNISGLTLSNQISVFASRVEAYLFENVREGSMRSLSVSLTLKQREPELSRCVMPHFEHSWHRFVQHCPNLSVFYYRQVDIEWLELHGYAEEHEARLRISRFPKQTCEQRDLSIVKHQQHHAELATVHALLLIRDTPLGVIELTQLRTLLSEKSPGFFKDMTRSAFKRLLTRVPKTPIWISGNYIKLRRNFALVPWANNLRFTGSECDPMSFAHQMVTRIVLPSNTSIHSNDAEMDEIECDIESRNPVTGMSDPTAVVNRTTEKQASALPSPYPSTDLWGSVGQDIWKESVHVAHDEHDPRFTTLHTRSTNNSLAAQLPFNS